MKADPKTIGDACTVAPTRQQKDQATGYRTIGKPAPSKPDTKEGKK